ncbi:MAG: GHKL domain-containing protein, partial [Myxococcales bacterium]|nr:GHKL domain-containing protein [Myxococcales bacterium]
RPFVETFAADLSHELKNPVAAIRASAEILDEEGALEEPEEARRFVKRIREATARIERLLSDLLNLAQIEARGIDEFDVLDMGDLLLASTKGLEGRERLNVSVKQDAKVRGDATWLGRAMANLLENALVHSPKGSPIEVLLERKKDNVVLRVINHGEVPARMVKRVFARFVTTRQDKGGTGLGLGIARAVAEAHSGQVELVQPGPPNVEFQLTLPHASLRDVALKVGGSFTKQ